MQVNCVNSGYQSLNIINELAKIKPELAAAQLGQTAKNLVALQILDSFLDAERLRISANRFCPYTAVGNTTAALDRSFYYKMASTIIAMA